MEEIGVNFEENSEDVAGKFEESLRRSVNLFHPVTYCLMRPLLPVVTVIRMIYETAFWVICAHIL